MIEFQTVELHGRQVAISIPNAAAKFRVKTLFSKEPDTIAWIDSMKPGEVFIDVGANIGLYSIYAATKGLKVYAFEPHAQTYAELVGNIQTNHLDIDAYCVALNDVLSWSRLYVSGVKAAGSLNNFAEQMGHRGTLKEFKNHQGCLGVRLDSLPWQADHIKIDVDGREDRVIAGALGKLANVKSVLVEINHEMGAHQAVVHALKSLGFRTDEEQIRRARRNDGMFANVGNVIFDRR